MAASCGPMRACLVLGAPQGAPAMAPTNKQGLIKAKPAWFVCHSWPFYLVSLAFGDVPMSNKDVSQ